MAKDKISDYSSTANSNTDIAGINIDEGCAPSGINDAIRTLMAQLKTWQSGGQDIYIHPAGSAAAPSITVTGDTNTGIFFPAADTVGISTGGTERARVDSSGNLGLGVTPSAWASAWKTFQIGTKGSVTGRTDANSVYLGTNVYYDGTSSKYIANGYASWYAQNDSAHYWYTAASGTAGNAISFTQAMTLDASGNLGVGQTSITAISSGKSSEVANLGNAGTTADNQDFVVRSTNRFASIAIIGNNTKGSNLYFGDGDSNSVGAIQYDHTNNYLSTTVNGAERTRIDSSGNLLVGLTAALGSQIGIQAAGGNGTSFTLRHTGATAGKFRLAGVDSSNNYLVYNNSNVGMYMGDGSTSWTATSDETQKVLTEEFTNALEFIKTVRATRGRYIADDETVSRSFLIAQDWQEYLPESISEKDGILGLSYQDTIPVLVKAIQEQQAIIQQLQADVAALKGQA